METHFCEGKLTIRSKSADLTREPSFQFTFNEEETQWMYESMKKYYDSEVFLLKQNYPKCYPRVDECGNVVGEEC